MLIIDSPEWQKNKVMNSLSELYHRLKHILLYGAILAALVLLLKWLQWRFLIADNSIDVYIGLIALFFTGLGVWIATQISKPSVTTVVVEKEIFVPQVDSNSVNEYLVEKLALTKREHEVLQLLSDGLSNGEIANRLFLSLSTIKTHVSRLYVKLDVKNRGQAINKAKKLNIVL